MESEDTKKIQGIKTDLNLLLECLKYQMNNPSSQKEVLVTIHSVCQLNSNAGLYFREIGGLIFVKDLAKSSEHSMVKEAALYVLGVVAEGNVYCQETLCTSEVFKDLTLLLSNDDSNTNLKRMSSYVLLVLVSNNRTGQTLVRETGCIEVLSQLFRTVLSDYELDLSDNNVFQSYQLWSSVCGTLCVCVNNPQNDENQMFCCCLFSHANKWLMNCMKTEIIRPICSVIGLTLANNTTFAMVLSKYHIVSKLLALLLHESLYSGEKISIILTLGHCTEDCEENQYELFKNNGLPLMIQTLTESKNEELNKAATYVLHNCQKITERLSLSLRENSFDDNEAKQLKDMKAKEKNLEEYWKIAKEIAHRIEQLEGKGNEENIQRGQYKDNTSSVKTQSQNKLKQLCADSIGGTKAECKDTDQARQSCGVVSKACANDNQMKTLRKNTNPVNSCYRESGQNGTLNKTSSSCTQNLHGITTFDQKDSVSQSSDHVFKHPTYTVKNRKQQVPQTDPFTLCLDIIDEEVVGFQATENDSRMMKYRCSGCITIRKPLNSRNFSKLLHSCLYQCDHHKVIVEAEDRYKSELRKSLICNKKILLTPHRRQRLNSESTAPEGIKKRIRKNFTKEEINYLFHGVKKMGNHWNSILWSFPFQQGRKAVDLAHKYHKLIKGPNCAAT
ncbi:telomere repeats-binding bouquet formation protein 1 isoform X3 [Nannospalax galili]|uniref:telomere repeats-binding bouquet formation protein 1 isoform X3 n=1 Tax=Nannospalax galili TaxID=1026970 RepID=UPI00111C0501|nr:telomere repeats-binding bouquet formation protein 1 isoform X3 [Nannospalax galili]